MARVAVIGGGFGGMASAARLAKLGHDVTLLEASGRLGGAVGFVEQDGYRWDSGPTHTALPAVIRDLFRKSGRPVDKEIELVPLAAVRHVFEDRTQLDLPSGSRAAQVEAIERVLGRDRAERWASYTDDFAEDWDLLRRDYLERPFDPKHAAKGAKRLLGTRLSLHRLVQQEFRRDRDLRGLALHRTILDGQEPRNTPAWMAMWAYVEQTFGLWSVPGGLGTLTEVLEKRLRTRGVSIVLDAPVQDIVLEGGKPVAVTIPNGPVAAEHVVVACDPRRLPALEKHVAGTMPALPPVVAHVGIRGPVEPLPAEVVLHGDPMLSLRTNGSAPDGCHAWTIIGRGKLAEDIVTSLARSGIRIRKDQVEVRVDRSPRDLARLWNGSPYGVLWQGRSTLDRVLDNRTPITNVWTAGAHTTPGSGLPGTGLSAARVAELIGPA